MPSRMTRGSAPTSPAGVHVDLSNKITVGEYARQWSAARVLRPGTRKVHEAFLRRDVVDS